MTSVATPLFQQGEQVIRRGEAIRYYKGKNGWSNTTGNIWLTNQRIVYWAGFGNQRNWPLDHIVKVQPGMIDTVGTVCVEFDNGMVEWFALDEQGSWIEAISAAVKKVARRPAPKPKPVNPVPESKPTPAPKPAPVLAERRARPQNMLVVGAAAALFAVCGCVLLVVAAAVFLKLF